jgi:hypothetical protein
MFLWWGFLFLHCSYRWIFSISCNSCDLSHLFYMVSVFSTYMKGEGVRGRERVEGATDPAPPSLDCGLRAGFAPGPTGLKNILEHFFKAAWGGY